MSSTSESESQTQPLVIPRDTLSSRIIPTITLSTSTNPLTTPYPHPHLPLNSGLNYLQNLTSTQQLPKTSKLPSQIATARFTVSGNVIVTGGCGDLGLSSIRALLEHGAQGIAIFDLIPESVIGKTLQTLRNEYLVYRRKIILLNVDVTSEEQVTKGVMETVKQLGSVDVLVNFAGVVSNIKAEETSIEIWKKVIDVNLNGSFICAQVVAKQMIDQKTGGSIVLIASIAGHKVLFPQPQVSYNVSKAGVIHLSKCLAAEWAHYGIRVNSISPGYMNTILNEGQGLEESRRIWNDRNPMGRMGEPEELTGIVVLLCSNIAGRYITGQDFVVDGGQLVF